MKPDPAGLVLCSRYSFAPNSLHYCGPERQKDMLGYVSHAASDVGLAEILNQFDTLYKYLVLIAQANNITDPFDKSVVEAYWLGNRLLRNVTAKALAVHLTDSLDLKRKVSAKQLTPMIDNVVDGGVPQHNFHVMNIFLRTGHVMATHTLPTMDNCRISWGKVVEKVEATDGRKDGAQYIVDSQPLIYKNGILALGPVEKKVVTSIGVVPAVGDWVSVHWSYICDVLHPAQRRQLAYYTNLAIGGANRGHII